MSLLLAGLNLNNVADLRPGLRYAIFAVQHATTAAVSGIWSAPTAGDKDGGGNDDKKHLQLSAPK